MTPIRSPGLDLPAELNEVAHSPAQYINRKISAKMPPQVFSRLLLAELHFECVTSNLEVVCNKAALDNNPPLHLHVRWKNDRGLFIERQIYTTLTPKGRFLLVYEAQHSCSSPKDWLFFESMIKSVHLLSRAT
jgi:hypothetical protein